MCRRIGADDPQILVDDHHAELERADEVGLVVPDERGLELGRDRALAQGDDGRLRIVARCRARGALEPDATLPLAHRHERHDGKRDDRKDRDESRLHRASIAQASVARRPMAHPRAGPLVRQETWPPRAGQRRERRWREGVAQDHEVGQPRRRHAAPARASTASTPAAGTAAAASPAASMDETRSASSSSGEVPGGHGSSDRLVHAGLPGGRRERLDAGRVQLGEALDEGADRVAVRAVARLTDGRLPATRQALAGAVAERLAEQLVEERRRGRAPSRSPRPRHGPRATRGRRIEPRVDGRLHRVERGELVGRQEPGDRRAEGDRCRLGAREPVDLVGLERGDPVQEAGQGLGRIERTVADGRAAPGGLRAPGVTESRPPVSRTDRRSATLVVVAGPELGVAEPVVGDVDPLRALEAGRRPATSGWCWRRSERQASSMTSGLASTAISRRA